MGKLVFSNYILIFDIGKTNKKYLIFDQDYTIVHEFAEELPESVDEDGFPCENIQLLTDWIYTQTKKILANTEYNVKAINFSGYGASFVLLDHDGKVTAPLYNYLKPLKNKIKNQFFETHGVEENICLETCSPSLGNLNSGLQLYRLKYELPELFAKIRHALHLPQYLSYIFTRSPASNLASIGCHTMLWNFAEENYHTWVKDENIDALFPANVECNSVYPITVEDSHVHVGVGLHDSSAALIPYLKLRDKSFILLSTGTWCIALNPFSSEPLNAEELSQDCLCYISYESKSIKASRLFLGHEHQESVRRMADHFHLDEHFYKYIKYNKDIIIDKSDQTFQDPSGLIKSGFEKRLLDSFADEIVAYHTLMHDLVTTQIKSLHLIQPHLRDIEILVDGGFAQNELYMSILAQSLPSAAVYAADIHQASAMGAAMAIHAVWNDRPIEKDLIKLKLF